jgi:subtilisin family serine protease
MLSERGVLAGHLILARRRRPLRWCRRLSAVLAGLSAVLVVAVPAHADVYRNTELWVINQLNLPAAWAHSMGRGVTVAVIDSGVNPDVSDLTGSVITGPDYTGVETPASDPGWGVHGTWMASLVAGHGHGPGDGSGIIGSAPEATVLSIRVITDTTDPNYSRYENESDARGQSELADAITYAVAHKAAVISMSLGYSMQSKPVRAALQYAYDHNVVVVASAGNSGDSAGATGTGHAPYSFPADYPGVLAVAAVNRNGQVASFSSENLSVQVAAPGDNVPAEGRDGVYWYVTGTSPACALTAGVVALIKSAYPDLTDGQVISAMTSSTTPSTRPAGGWDEQIGFGEVNAGAALAAAGRIAAAGPAAAGVAAAAHFGGGPAAVPPVPVAPRGPAAIVGYGLLAVICLGLVALATGRLLGGSSDARGVMAAGRPSPGPARPAPGPAGPAAGLDSAGSLHAPRASPEPPPASPWDSGNYPAEWP